MPRTEYVGGSGSASALRQQAEERLRARSAGSTAMSAADVQALVHELRVHQIELEMQNEELRQAQVELAVARDRYVDLYEFAPVGYLTLDSGEVIREANLAAATMFGVERGKMPGTKLPRFLTPESSDVFHRHLEQVSSSRTKGSCDLTVGRLDGSRFLGHLETVPGPIHKGGDGFWLTISDITERALVEQGLRRSEEQFRALFQLSSVGMAQTDLTTGRFVRVNRKMCEITGFSEAALLARMPEEIVHPDDQARVRQAYAGLQDGRMHTWAAEGRFVRQDGRVIGVDVCWTVLRDPVGVPTGTIGVIQDITARQQAEDELLWHRAHLAELVDQRTRELRLAQKELLHKERLATLGQLFGTVSHELRNPLGTVRTSIYSIAERVSGKGLNIEHALERAERNIERCDLILEELLDFSHAKVLNPSRTRIDAWLSRVLDDQPIAGDIVLRRELASGLELMIDPERLRQCVVNLLTNAVQAVQEGGRADRNITVSTRQAAGRLEIAVTDNGSGIAPEDLPKVFEPLYSTRSFGVGLGLCIVKQISELHGGGVDLQSDPGRGTTARLWLPLAGPEGTDNEVS